jgi:hypothetical protein
MRGQKVRAGACQAVGRVRQPFARATSRNETSTFRGTERCGAPVSVGASRALRQPDRRERAHPPTFPNPLHTADRKCGAGGRGGKAHHRRPVGGLWISSAVASTEACWTSSAVSVFCPCPSAVRPSNQPEPRITVPGHQRCGAIALEIERGPRRVHRLLSVSVRCLEAVRPSDQPAVRVSTLRATGHAGRVEQHQRHAA